MSGATRQIAPVVWDKRFSARQEIYKKVANTPYLEYYISESSDDESENGDPDSESDGESETNGSDFTELPKGKEDVEARNRNNTRRKENGGRNEVKECGECGGDLGVSCRCKSDPHLRIDTTSSNTRNPTVAAAPSTTPAGAAISTTPTDRSLRIRDPVRNFFRSHIDSDNCLPQVDRIEEFCSGASLGGLLDNERTHKRAAVATVDEGSFFGDVYHRRGPAAPVPVNARGLYFLLKDPPFVESEITTPGGSEGRGKPSDIDVDVDRRLIFITNLDKWTLYALIYTASDFHAAALRDGLYRHLDFQPSIEVKLSTDGIPTFDLSFHLPYYALRTSQTLCVDPRIDKNAIRLRQGEDISFLNWEAGAEPCFLYPAQISCVICGVDEWRYNGYCWVDTYFDHENTRAETVPRYCDDARLRGLRGDPFTRGKKDSNIPQRDPRAYFLEIFYYRLYQVSQEWEQVAIKLSSSVKQYKQASRSFSITQSMSTSDTQENSLNKCRFRDWVVAVRRLSGELSKHLSDTFKTCERYCARHAYFLDLPRERGGLPLFQALQILLNRLDQQRNRLEALSEECKEFAQDLETQLLLESIEMSGRHHVVAEETRRITVIMCFFVSPLALASLVFSMEDKLIGLIPRRLIYFFGAVASLGFLFGTLYIVIFRQTEFRAVVMGMLGQEKSVSLKKLKLSEALRRRRRSADTHVDDA